MMKKLIHGTLPLVLLAIPVLLILLSDSPLPFGGAVVAGDRPAIEEIMITRTTLKQNLIEISFINDGPDPVEIRQVLVNGGYWAYEIRPDGPIGRMKSGKILIEFPWNTGDDQHITLITSSGVTFDTTIVAAVESPTTDLKFAALLAGIGFLIGVVPVLLGLLWFPFVRSLSGSWYAFFLAITIGLLIFLGIDSLQEAFELAPFAPESLNGIGVLLLGFSLSFLGLFYLSRGRRSRIDTNSERTGPRFIAFSAALGIGVHNLGEGLAVGSAFALGNISLGATLIVGFMIHNITEGLPIITPLAKERPKIGYLAALGLLAGGPAILGTWIGGYAYSAIWGVFFLGIGAGAIFQVAIEVASFLARKSVNRLFTSHAVAGYLIGLLVMYGTGLIISG
jgi:zinc transporter, ZIP family